MKLYDCRILRRGKAASGSVECQTIGKPIVNEEGISQKWDYSDFINTPDDEVLKHIEESEIRDAQLFSLLNLITEMGLSQVECLARGFDAIQKSGSIKAQNASSLLQARLLREGLAVDAKEAKNVALAFIQIRSNSEMMGDDIPTFDFLCEKRKVFLEKQKRAA